MPNVENIRVWVTGLRSGQYPQSLNVLAHLDNAGKPDGYCCLGVACELSGLGQWEPAANDSHEGVYVVDGVRAAGILSRPISDWLGLPGDNPTFDVEWNEDFDSDEADSGPVQVSATGANDDRGMNFTQIADALEATYLTQ